MRRPARRPSLLSHRGERNKRRHRKRPRLLLQRQRKPLPPLLKVGFLPLHWLRRSLWKKVLPWKMWRAQDPAAESRRLILSHTWKHLPSNPPLVKLPLLLLLLLLLLQAPVPAPVSYTHLDVYKRQIIIINKS